MMLTKTELLEANKLLENQVNDLKFKIVELETKINDNKKTKRKQSNTKQNNELETKIKNLENKLETYKGNLNEMAQTNQELRDENTSLKITIDEIYKKTTSQDKEKKDENDFSPNMLKSSVEDFNKKVLELQGVIKELENKIAKGLK